MTWKELGISNYNQYLKTPHWRKIQEDLIYSKRGVKCWICSKTSNLVPHHARYDNLGHEKLLRDLFILCQDCHTQVHFWGFGQWKTKLNPSDLLRRMYYLKSKYYLQHRQFIRSVFNLIPALLY